MEWFDIKGYEGLYQINRNGEIRSLSHYTKFKNRTSYHKGKLLKMHDNGRGYFKVALCKDGKQKMFYIHRLVAGTFIDNPNNYPQVNHINGNKKDNRVENLEWVTDLENKQHGIANNLYAKGSKCHKKFTKNNVKDIRNSNKKISELAKEYNVSVNSISNIINYKTYKERKW